MIFPLALAAFFWTAPTIYGWADMTYLIPCKQFCFKEQTPQGRLLDAFRRQGMASDMGVHLVCYCPVRRGTMKIALRVARSGRDAVAVMDLNIGLNDRRHGAMQQDSACGHQRWTTSAYRVVGQQRLMPKLIYNR